MGSFVNAVASAQDRKDHHEGMGHKCSFEECNHEPCIRARDLLDLYQIVLAATKVLDDVAWQRTSSLERLPSVVTLEQSIKALGGILLERTLTLLPELLRESAAGREVDIITSLRRYVPSIKIISGNPKYAVTVSLDPREEAALVTASKGICTVAPRSLLWHV
jgi:hypothetical protein